MAITLADLKKQMAETEKAKNARKLERESGIVKFNILVIDAYGEEVVSETSGKAYTRMLVEYRNLNTNQLKEKKAAAFTDEGKRLLYELEPQKTYQITETKEGEFWKWTNISLIKEEPKDVKKG